MFGQRSDRGEGLAAFIAFDLQATVRMHALVSTEVAELRVRLVAHFALKRLD